MWFHSARRYEWPAALVRIASRRRTLQRIHHSAVPCSLDFSCETHRRPLTEITQTILEIRLFVGPLTLIAWLILQNLKPFFRSCSYRLRRSNNWTAPADSARLKRPLSTARASPKISTFFAKNSSLSSSFPNGPHKDAVIATNLELAGGITRNRSADIRTFAFNRARRFKNLGMVEMPLRTLWITANQFACASVAAFASFSDNFTSAVIRDTHHSFARIALYPPNE